MKLSDFDFELPKELIAQSPHTERGGSKLLVINKREIQNFHFDKIIDFLDPGDCLVLNDTKVLKSRILLQKDAQQLEIFLHKQIDSNVWQAFAKPAKKFNIGDVFQFSDGALLVKDKLITGELLIQTQLAQDHNIATFLEKHGNIPLPPYIKRKANNQDDERYQTVFAKNQGSVAAPTAGLHFTDKLLEQIKNKGVNICYITLHVGAGTFLPVKCQDISQHKMHSENCQISQTVANIINTSKQQGKKIIAVGTTSLRALESAASTGEVRSGNFETNIFITPGFKFQIVDLLLTNFHLPKSTLLMLACAFGGYENIIKAYNFAINNNFYFFSYGDASLIAKHE